MDAATEREHLDAMIALRSQGTRHRYFDKANEPPSVRVYKSTPEDVTLQIRRKYEYVSANLTVLQAIELRDALTVIVAEFSERYADALRAQAPVAEQVTQEVPA